MTEVDRWEEWFDATGDEESMRSWRAARSISADPVILDRWAMIIELARLDRVTKKAPATFAGAGTAVGGV